MADRAVFMQILDADGRVIHAPGRVSQTAAVNKSQ